MSTRILLLSILTAAALPPVGVRSASAQLLSDTLFTWQGYSHDSICRIRIYRSAENQKKPLTIIVGELAENEGASTLDDARHVAELVARSLSIDPEEAFWIFHWGAFSYPGAETVSKETFLRGTFRRSDTGTLGLPFWRLVTRETVVEYTDRAFR